MGRWSLGRSDVGPLVGRGVFLAGENRWSFDKGKTWKVTRGNGSRRTIFVDLGATWKAASGSLECSSLWHFGGYIAQSAGITVIVDAERNVCRSTNGGATMTKVATLGSSGQIGKVLVVDSLFQAFCTDGSVYRSSDGVTWQTFVHKPVGAKPHIVARSAGGTFSGINGQNFYRSAAGLSWTKNGSFSGARFTELTFGYTRRPSVFLQ